MEGVWPRPSERANHRCDTRGRQPEAGRTQVATAEDATRPPAARHGHGRGGGRRRGRPGETLRRHNRLGGDREEGAGAGDGGGEWRPRMKRRGRKRRSGHRVPG